MGSSFIITETMLEKKGKELMLEFYKNIHDKDMLTFDEIKSQRKFYDENVIKIYRSILSRKRIKFYNVVFNTSNKELEDRENDKKIKDRILEEELSDREYEDKFKDEYWLQRIEDKIKNKKIGIEFVFEYLSKMDKKLNLDSCLEFELNEDLFNLKKAFLNAYDLFYLSGYNLKD